TFAEHGDSDLPSRDNAAKRERDPFRFLKHLPGFHEDAFVFYFNAIVQCWLLSASTIVDNEPYTAGVSTCFQAFSRQVFADLAGFRSVRPYFALLHLFVHVSLESLLRYNASHLDCESKCQCRIHPWWHTTTAHTEVVNDRHLSSH